MNKLFAMLVAAALMMPLGASAQTYYYRDYDGNYHTSYSNVYQQNHMRIAQDRAELARAQDILVRDREMGRWWAISGDVQRVREAQARLDMDLAAYDAHRTVPPTRTYRYWYRY